MHRLLVNSRFALEHTSGGQPNKWIRDLLFMFACRRVIMLNRLDRELGTMGLPLKNSKRSESTFGQYVASSVHMTPEFCVSAAEEEEVYLKRELQEMMLQPGLPGHTRQMVSELLDEAQQNLNDLYYLRENLPLLSGAA